MHSSSFDGKNAEKVGEQLGNQREKLNFSKVSCCLAAVLIISAQKRG